MKTDKYNKSKDISVKVRRVPRENERNRRQSREGKKESKKAFAHGISRELIEKINKDPKNKTDDKRNLSRMYFVQESKANYFEVNSAFYDEITRKLMMKPLEFFLDKEIKVGFVVYNSQTHSNIVEWMWLKVLDVNHRDNCIVAKLVNDSFFTTTLRYGDVMCIKKDMIGLVLDPYDVDLFMNVNRYYFTTDPQLAYNALSDYILSLNLQIR